MEQAPDAQNTLPDGDSTHLQTAPAEKIDAIDIGIAFESMGSKTSATFE